PAPQQQIRVRGLNQESAAPAREQRAQIQVELLVLLELSDAKQQPAVRQETLLLQRQGAAAGGARRLLILEIRVRFQLRQPLACPIVRREVAAQVPQLVGALVREADREVAIDARQKASADGIDADDFALRQRVAERADRDDDLAVARGIEQLSVVDEAGGHFHLEVPITDDAPDL